MEECTMSLTDFVQGIRTDFEKCRKNMESMEKGLQFVESYFTNKNFPGWTWRIYPRGTYQNKPSFEIDGNSSQNISEYATISLKYNCCNNKNPVFIIQTIKPKMNAWNLEWNDKQIYRDKMDPVIKTFEGMKFKNLDPFIPQIAKILTDIKKLEDVNNGVLQLKSIQKQIQLKKDF